MISTNDIETSVLNNKTFYQKKIGGKYHLLIKEPYYTHKDRSIVDPNNKEIRYFVSDKPFKLPTDTIENRDFFLNLESSLQRDVEYLGKKTEIKTENEIRFKDGIRKKKVNNHWKTWYCKSIIYDGELKTPIDFFIKFFAKNKLNNKSITEKLGLPSRIDKELSSLIKTKMQESLADINKAMKTCKFIKK